MAFLFKREPVLQESSTNVELENLQHFLESVASHILSGFGQLEIAGLVTLANGMAVDDETEKEVVIVYAGQKSKMRVRLFMDDIGEANVYIFSPPDLATRIDADIEKSIGSGPV